MKILTEGVFSRADGYIVSAIDQLERAERLIRNAHRTRFLHMLVESAIYDAKRARNDMSRDLQSGFLAPPRTRKVLRIEQRERETMGSLDAPEDRGAGDSPGTVPGDGKQGNPR